MRSKSTHKKNTIEQIAAQLNVDIKAAEGFVAEVRQLVGPVKYIVILNTLRRVKDPRQTSPEAVASLIPSPTLKTPREKQQKSRPITRVISILQPVTTKSSRPTTIAQIAIELHGDIRGAKSFAAQVRSIMSGRHIKDNQILRAIKQIGDWRKVTPDKVASLLYVPVSEKDKISEIAKELTVNIRSAEAFVFQVWKLYGSNIEHQEILAAIERVKNREQIITPQAVVSEFSPNKGQVTPKKIVIAKATQVNKSIFTASTLVEEFEADSHQSTQTLFAELGLQLVSGEHLLSAKDNSTYPLEPSLIISPARGQTYLQGLADQAIALSNIGKLEQLVVLLNIPKFGSEAGLPMQATTAILSAIAIDIAKDGQLLRQILLQLIAHLRQKKLANRFTYHVLLNLYFRANLVRDKSYMAHFDNSGNVLFKIMPSQNLTTFYTFATHSIWPLVWKLSSTSLPLLLPGLGQRETWFGHADIPKSFQATFHHGYTSTLETKTLVSYSRDCFTELKNKRRYQIPSQGRAEIIASERLKNLIGLNLIRFVQEDVKPSGVFLRFEFGVNRPAVGLVKVKGDGSVEGFYEFFTPNNLFKAIVEAIALAYYRDLVTPGKVYYYQPGRRDPRARPYRPPNPKPRDPKELPRPQNIPLHAKNNPRLKYHPFHHLHTWHEAKERAMHSVVGHIRWIGEGFVANPEKQQQALQHLGKKLPPGYTFVIEHDRGGLGSGGLRLSPDGNLIGRTLFLPPERASAELDKLL